MLAAQSHYGPHDSRWTAVDDHLALGRNLYRCLPQDDDDAQPLTGGGGRYRLVADLRLDNRDELLARFGVHGAEAAAMADASLLLLAWERLGEEVLESIVGDYAFALWDAETRRLLLARDALGQRPLCYHRGRDFFAFASMPKGLHALDDVPRRPDTVLLAEFVGTVPYLGGRTFYRDVSRVEPGHAVVVGAGEVRSRRVWKPRRRELGLKGFDEYRDAFRFELDRAVQCRLRGAVNPVAAHLSSGWDSSAVTATAARLLAPAGGRVAAYTAVPHPENRSRAPFRRIADEGPIAAATAAFHENIDHHLVEGSRASPIAGLDRKSDLFDRPLINLCNELWLAQIRAAAAAGGANVLLTGEIGNWTISASPPSLLADLIRERRWRAWWREARAKISKGDARLRGIAASSFGPWLPIPLWRLVTRYSAAPAASDYSAVQPHLWAAMAAKRDERGGFLGRPPRDSFADTAASLTQYDHGHFRKAALAGWGIDERDPTADTRLIDFCLSLPVDMLLKDGVRRPLAREALSDRLPAAVLQEKSKGYQAADWHEGLTRDRASVAALVDRLAQDDAASSVIDFDALRQWIREWPEAGWESLPVLARYRVALLQALGAGHFVASMEKAECAS